MYKYDKEEIDMEITKRFLNNLLLPLFKNALYNEDTLFIDLINTTDYPDFFFKESIGKLKDYDFTEEELKKVIIFGYNTFIVNDLFIDKINNYLYNKENKIKKLEVK